MPQAADLMGFGMSPFLSDQLGNSYQAVTGAGTTQAGAAKIYSEGHLVLVTGASSATGALLPSAAKIGTPYFILSVGSAAAVIYPNSTTGTINGGSAGAGFTCSAAVSGYVFMKTAQTSAGVDTWYTIPKV
jgi:hypothetical protein